MCVYILFAIVYTLRINIHILHTLIHTSSSHMSYTDKVYAHDLDTEAKRKEARQQMRVDVLVKDAAVHVAQVEEATRAAR